MGNEGEKYDFLLPNIPYSSAAGDVPTTWLLINSTRVINLSIQ